MVTSDEENFQTNGTMFDTIHGSLQATHVKEALSSKHARQNFECNHVTVVNFVHETEERLAFCADIGAPRSVIGIRQLRKILTYLDREGIPAIAC